MKHEREAGDRAAQTEVAGAVVTLMAGADDLADLPEQAPDPVQQAFVEASAFQCGFCTPGFVLMTRQLLDGHPDPDEDTIKHYLSGNLCRCAGYEQILKAGLEVNGADVARLKDLYPVQPLLAALREHAGDALHVRADDREFFKPVTVAQAIDFKSAHPKPKVDICS